MLYADIGEHISKHGDGVKDIAFEVEDLDAIFEVHCIVSCINRALFRIFGSCDKSSLVYIKTCTGLNNIKAIVDKRDIGALLIS